MATIADTNDLVLKTAPSGPLSIEICNAAGRNDWDEFVRSQPGGSFYHLYDWEAVNRESFGHATHYLYARERGRVRGILPLVTVSSPLFGRILCSVPFVNFGGPVSDDARIQKELIAVATQYAREQSVDYLELRCTQALDTDLPVSLRKISMSIQLAPDPDTLWNGFTSKHRKNVKRAYKHGLEVRKGGIDLLHEFYQMMEISWRMLGTPLYGKAYFDRVLRTFPDNSSVFICHRHGEPIAAALTGYCNGVVEGLWAGGGAQARLLDANYVLYWEMIKDACLRGCHSFHLGRSTADSGGEEFKRKWNAETQQLYWYFYRPQGGEMPALNVDNPKYRLAIKTWRKLPLWATRLIGARVAPLIP